MPGVGLFYVNFPAPAGNLLCRSLQQSGNAPQVCGGTYNNRTLQELSDMVIRNSCNDTATFIRGPTSLQVIFSGVLCEACGRRLARS